MGRHGSGCRNEMPLRGDRKERRERRIKRTKHFLSAFSALFAVFAYGLSSRAVQGFTSTPLQFASARQRRRLWGKLEMFNRSTCDGSTFSTSKFAGGVTSAETARG